jgi:hypothetical protein
LNAEKTALLTEILELKKTFFSKKPFFTRFFIDNIPPWSSNKNAFIINETSFVRPAPTIY